MDVRPATGDVLSRAAPCDTHVLGRLGAARATRVAACGTFDGTITMPSAKDTDGPRYSAYCRDLDSVEVAALPRLSKCMHSKWFVGLPFESRQSTAKLVRFNDHASQSFWCRQANR